MWKYREYSESMQKLYDNCRCFGFSMNTELRGLPGTGIDTFIKRFCSKYDPILQKSNIFIVHVTCPTTNPRELFASIVNELLNVLKKHLLQLGCTSSYRNELAILESESNKLKEQLKDNITVNSYVSDVKRALDMFNCFKNLFNIRLFVRRFDNIKRLLEEYNDYAGMIKTLCESYKDWLGVIITTNRSVYSIAKAVKVESEFATLSDGDISLQGFSNAHMDALHHDFETQLKIHMDNDAKETLNYYCGNNPKRLNLMWLALEVLRQSCSEAEWESSLGKTLIAKAYEMRKTTMDNQATYMLRCINDIGEGTGIDTMKIALGSPYLNTPGNNRTQLYDGGILRHVNSREGLKTEATIPQIGEMVVSETITSETVKTVAPSRILHLSDLHFNVAESEDEKEERKKILAKFIEKLKDICRETPIDYIIISGDIGWSGNQGDYEYAKPFVDKVMKICNVNKDHLILCPGNHDVVASENEDLVYPGTQSESEVYLSLDKLQKRSEPFVNYTAFCKDIGCFPYEAGSHQSWLTGVRSDDKFIFCCLNTAWCANYKKPDRKMWTGKRYVDAIENKTNELIGEDARPVITIMHHPFDEWAEEERCSFEGSENVKKTLGNLSELIMCGHTHERDQQNETMNRACILKGGALYVTDKHRNAFYVYEYCIDNKEIKKLAFTYDGSAWLLAPTQS